MTAVGRISRKHRLCVACGKPGLEYISVDSKAGQRKRLSYLLWKYGELQVPVGYVCTVDEKKLLNLAKYAEYFRDKCQKTSKHLRSIEKKCMQKNNTLSLSPIGFPSYGQRNKSAEEVTNRHASQICPTESAKNGSQKMEIESIGETELEICNDLEEIDETERENIGNRTQKEFVSASGIRRYGEIEFFDETAIGNQEVILASKTNQEVILESKTSEMSKEELQKPETTKSSDNFEKVSNDQGTDSSCALSLHSYGKKGRPPEEICKCVEDTSVTTAVLHVNENNVGLCEVALSSLNKNVRGILKKLPPLLPKSIKIDRDVCPNSGQINIVPVTNSSNRNIVPVANSSNINIVPVANSSNINIVPVANSSNRNIVPVANSSNINIVPVANPINIVPVANPINIVPVANPINIVPVANPINIVTVANSLNIVPVANPLNIVPVANPINIVPVANPINIVSGANPINIVSAANSVETKKKSGANSFKINNDSNANSSEVKKDSGANSSKKIIDSGANSCEMNIDSGANSCEMNIDLETDSGILNKDYGTNTSEINKDSGANSVEIMIGSGANSDEINIDCSDQSGETNEDHCENSDVICIDYDANSDNVINISDDDQSEEINKESSKKCPEAGKRRTVLQKCFSKRHRKVKSLSKLERSNLISVLPKSLISVRNCTVLHQKLPGVHRVTGK